MLLHVLARLLKRFLQGLHVRWRTRHLSIILQDAERTTVSVRTLNLEKTDRNGESKTRRIRSGITGSKLSTNRRKTRGREQNKETGEREDEWKEKEDRNLDDEREDLKEVLIKGKNRLAGKTPWPQSASELYRPNDRRLLAKLMPTFADRVPRGQRDGSLRP
jgi:hypothetical protein